MSTGHIVAIVVGGFLTWITGAGVAQKLGKWNLAEIGPVGLAWPFMLPWALGSYVAGKSLRSAPPALPEARVVKKAGS